ncbi:hypothetical protein MHU86_9289 [Fragilaria crotonensis]|nr:hypothetical protein MHU86_9289 [Fragilaria crotonensis]
MWMLANTFNERLPLYLGQHQALRGTPWYEVYPAHIVRHVRINVYKYMQALQVGNSTTARVTSPPGIASVSPAGFVPHVLGMATLANIRYYRADSDYARTGGRGLYCHQDHACINGYEHVGTNLHHWKPWRKGQYSRD